jgi:hypothetical protein
VNDIGWKSSEDTTQRRSQASEIETIMPFHNQQRVNEMYAAPLLIFVTLPSGINHPEIISHRGIFTRCLILLPNARPMHRHFG